MWGSGYCRFIDRRLLDSWRTRLLTTGSMFVERTHTHTLNSTAVRAWGVTSTWSFLDSSPSLLPTLDCDPVMLRRRSGILGTPSCLSLNRVSIRASQFYPVLSSFPNPDNLSIVGLGLSQPPPGNVPACPRTQGKFTLDEGTHNTCVPFLLGLPVQFRAPYFYDTADVERLYTRLCALVRRRSSLWKSEVVSVPSPQPPSTLNKNK